MKKRAPISKKLRAEVYNKSDGKCAECTLHIHHIDGDRSNNSLANLVLLCAKHHIGKHDGLEALGKMGGTNKGINHRKKRSEMFNKIKDHITFEELVAILDSRPRRSNKWLETKIEELIKY